MSNWFSNCSSFEHNICPSLPLSPTNLVTFKILLFVFGSCTKNKRIFRGWDYCRARPWGFTSLEVCSGLFCAMWLWLWRWRLFFLPDLSWPWQTLYVLGNVIFDIGDHCDLWPHWPQGSGYCYAARCCDGGWSHYWLPSRAIFRIWIIVLVWTELLNKIHKVSADSRPSGPK